MHFKAKQIPIFLEQFYAFVTTFKQLSVCIGYQNDRKL